MADSNKNPDKLIEQVISFIQNERELYGDFGMNTSFVDKNQKTQQSQTDKKARNSSSSVESVSEPSEEFNARSTSPSDESESTDAQENSSNDDSKDVYDYIDKCSTLEELETLCQKADVLRTDLEDTQLVFGVGNPNADLMLIGEAPGAEEDRQGEPFVGKAGQLLNKILAAINFDRDDIYIANILKHRPPNNRNPKPEERARSLPFLLCQIDIIEPKLILALGKISAQTLLDNNSSLGSMRGKFHNFRDKYELMATYHPAALLRHPKWKRPTWEDVQLLRKRYDELGGTP